MSRPTGVLLLSFGSAVTSADVPDYLRSVRGGRDAPAELIAEFKRRFDLIGRSPLIDITRRQASALEAHLDAQQGPGAFAVATGMLHSRPTVAEAVDTLVSREASSILALVMAPQYSPLILSGYQRALDEVRQRLPSGFPMQVARAWHRVPGWIESLSERLREALGKADAAVPCSAVVFTAHSLPRVVVERDLDYQAQLRETVELVATAAKVDISRRWFAYQSAGHSAQEWLKPDLADVLVELAAAGHRQALVVPVQFVADHLETLYDIDIAAAQQAADAGIGFGRIAMPNDSATFIGALAEVVQREMTTAAAASQ